MERSEAGDSPPISQVADALMRHYGIELGEVTNLPGELDRNLHVISNNGEHYLVRLYHQGQDRHDAEFEADLLARLAQRAPDVRIPRIVPTVTGEPLCGPNESTADRLVRVTTWLHGAVWAEAVVGVQAADGLGRFLGRLDDLLHEISCDLGTVDVRLEHRWDMAHAARLLADTEGIVEPERRSAVRAILSHYQDHLAPALRGQRRQIIHNDANDYNLIVPTNPVGPIDIEGIGLIDFGDAVHSLRIHEVAVACAYAMLGDDDPLGIAAAVASGYHLVNPLTEIEVDALYDLILTRYAMSITLAARQAREQPTNDYLNVSQRAVRAMLDHLLSSNQQIARARLRAACGFAAVPSSPALTRWLLRNGHRAHPVIRRPLDAAHLVVLGLEADGTASTNRAASLDPFYDDEALATLVPIGRFGEDRDLYTTDAFATADPDERRTIHVGLDLFAPAGEEVIAPFDATVADVGIESVPLGFGGIIVLAHHTDDGTPFWTLYGHLAHASIRALPPGTTVTAGQTIGRLGVRQENGGWPTHLHFQVMTSLLGWSATEIIGVVTRSGWDVWRSVFLNPNLVLGLPVDCSAVVRRDDDALRRERRWHLGRSLSLSYQQPLKIVAGEGAWLVAEDGRRYLDMVNNVCHVGHCHPRVVAAGQRQMGVLNTNTRYLHDLFNEYAQRLSATLPEPLSVVFMVNSGSEANDLALRLARAYTTNRDVITVDHVYHGNLTSIVDISPYKFNGPGGEGRRDGVWVTEMPDSYRGRVRGDDSAPAYVESLAHVIEEMQAHGRRPAAIFSEAVLGTGGMLTLPAGYLARAFDLVRDAGGVCVCDEVQIGFGRVGSEMWAFETQGVVPDIVTMGKPIGNGHPMAAVVTTPQIAAAFANGMEYFSTFGGNPVSAAIGLAVLDVLRDERLMHNADVVGAAMRDGLRRLAHDHPIIGDVRGFGLFNGVEFVRDQTTLEPADRELRAIVEAMKQRQVLLSVEGPHDNVLKIKPPLVFSLEDNARFLDHLEKCLQGL